MSEQSRYGWVLANIPLLLEALWFLGLAKLGLLFLPFTRIRKKFEIPLKPGSSHLGITAEAVQVAEVINRLGYKFLGDSACLPQALAGIRMLRQRGYPVELQLGVRKKEPYLLTAHAWVVLEGLKIIGQYDENKYQYAPLQNPRRS